MVEARLLLLSFCLLIYFDREFGVGGLGKKVRMRFGYNVALLEGTLFASLSLPLHSQKDLGGISVCRVRNPLLGSLGCSRVFCIVDSL